MIRATTAPTPTATSVARSRPRGAASSARSTRPPSIGKAGSRLNSTSTDVHPEQPLDEAPRQHPGVEQQGRPQAPGR